MAAINGISPSIPSSDMHDKHVSAPSGTPATPVFSLPVRLPLASPGNAVQVGGSAPNFLPLASQPHGKSAHEVQEDALKLHAYRLQLIASNIANADTPNYKAVDIDFREALRLTQSTVASSNLNADRSHHLPGTGTNLQAAIPIKYSVPQQASADGNTVELEAERAKFAESAVRYEFSLNRVGGHYKMMMELLTNLKD